MRRKIKIYRRQMCSFKLQMRQNPFSAGEVQAGPCWGSLWRSPRSPSRLGRGHPLPIPFLPRLLWHLDLVL